MSQAGVLTVSTSGASVIETLTGNSGGAVSPDASHNINILGNNTSGINVVGNPGTNTLSIVGIQSTTSQRGTVTLATNAQAIAGSDTSNAITSAALSAKLGTQTAHSLAVFEGTSSALTALGVATNGQLPIGSTGADPVLATITAGAGISVANGAGSITISSSGSPLLNITFVTNLDSPYVVNATDDDFISCDTSGGVITLQFPNAPSTGKSFIVKDSQGTSATSNITLTTVGGIVTFDGSTSYTMNVNYQAVNLVFDGTSYEVY